MLCRHRDSRDGSGRSSSSSGRRDDDRHRDGRNDRDSRPGSVARDSNGSRSGGSSWEAATPRRRGGEDEWEMTPSSVSSMQLRSLQHLGLCVSQSSSVECLEPQCQVGLQQHAQLSSVTNTARP